MTFALVPTPRSVVELPDGPFVLHAGTTISTAPQLVDAAEVLGELLRPATGLPLHASRRGDIEFHQGPVAGTGPEAYELTVRHDRVRIVAADRLGALRAVQTFRQLLPPEVFSREPVNGVEWSAPAVHIDDHPEHRWRGAHLDVVRHMMPIEFVHRFIDLLALHKLNRLHLHLTDDQGWRFEVTAYPLLTEIGAWRPGTVVGVHVPPWQDDGPHDGIPHGGFYTRADMTGVIEHARRLGIEVVPEIEMPGHSQAAIAAYPSLGNGIEIGVGTGWGVSPHILSVADRTLDFCRDVLDEVFDVFPSEFVHLGADEVPKDEWRSSELAQARMREHGLRTEDELQSWFMRRMTEFVHSRGRRAIGWDEILDGGLPAGAAVMSWRGERGGIAAAELGHDVVMAPFDQTYFDYYQGDPANEPLAHGTIIDVASVHRYRPVPVSLDPTARAHVIGAQFQLWTEYMSTPEHVEYMAFPRACAFADVVWGSPVDGDEFHRSTLPAHVVRLDLLRVNTHPFAGETVEPATARR